MSGDPWTLKSVGSYLLSFRFAGLGLGFDGFLGMRLVEVAVLRSALASRGGWVWRNRLYVLGFRFFVPSTSTPVLPGALRGAGRKNFSSFLVAFEDADEDIPSNIRMFLGDMAPHLLRRSIGVD